MKKEIYRIVLYNKSKTLGKIIFQNKLATELDINLSCFGKIIMPSKFSIFRKCKEVSIEKYDKKKNLWIGVCGGD